ncbi:hypothetical protein NKH24_33655 [Mesorhizobium sp. M1300]|uniref:hypothetical protein n=1 Tax=Mesorhizobium sp. M1300 TaxID=2957077 RepID=UPI0033374B85
MAPKLAYLDEIERQGASGRAFRPDRPNLRPLPPHGLDAIVHAAQAVSADIQIRCLKALPWRLPDEGAS